MGTPATPAASKGADMSDNKLTDERGLYQVPDEPDAAPQGSVSAPVSAMGKASAPKQWDESTPLEPLNVNGTFSEASYGATELAIWITDRLAHNETTGDDWEVIPEAIEEYAAARVAEAVAAERARIEGEIKKIPNAEGYGVPLVILKKIILVVRGEEP
jgi:hypothetical protein